jgi:hypothetical protein
VFYLQSLGDRRGLNPRPWDHNPKWCILSCSSLFYLVREFHQRRLDRLHKRYLSSIKTLAQIRKLGPAVQINIAEKQINTAG